MLQAALAIANTDTHLVVKVAPDARFASIEPDARLLDAGMGLSARFGKTPQGADDLYELHFDRARWDEAKVRSFLAKQGFDRAAHDHVALEQRAQPPPPADGGAWTKRDGAKGRVVYENEDWWVLPGTIPTREGVMNGGFKPWAELEKSGLTFEGVPVTYPHPDDIVRGEDFPRIGGLARNIKLNAADKQLEAEVWLARRPVPGLKVSAEAIKHNEEAVTRFLAGDDIHNSVGFLFQADPTRGDHAGVAYDVVQRNIIGNHLALLGIGQNREDGACSWGARCGLGRAQGDAQPTHQPAAHGGEPHRDAHAPHGEGSPRNNEGDTPMANCASDAATCSRRDQELRETRGALDQIGGHLGKPGNATPTDVLTAARERCAEFDRLKAQVTTLTTERDGLKDQVGKRVKALAAECADLEVQVSPLAQNKGEDAEDFKARGEKASKAARERYEGFTLDALEHQRGLLQRALDGNQEKGKAPASRDGARASGKDDGPRGLVRSSDAWPRKTAKAAEQGA